MSSDEQTYRLADDIRYRLILDEAVAVRQKTNEVIVINEVSASILEFFESGKKGTIAGLIDYLASEYDVEKNVLEKDTPSHIEELLAAGILISEGE